LNDVEFRYGTTIIDIRLERVNRNFVSNKNEKNSNNTKGQQVAIEEILMSEHYEAGKSKQQENLTSST
jgi:hypothetical protein